MTNPFLSTSREMQRSTAFMLRDARNKLGLAVLWSLLPKPFELRINSHDTGCQAEICALKPGLPSLDIWAGSSWYSSSYEFNDRDRVLGMKPDADFAEPHIRAFFDAVEAALKKHDEDAAAAETRAKADAAAKHAATVEAYRKLLADAPEVVAVYRAPLPEA